MPKSCSTCKTKQKSNLYHRSSWLSALLVIILPKCPLCAIAYSSAITICGGSGLFYAQNNWVSYVPLVLGLIVCILLMLNYRGVRTWLALGVAVTGIIILIFTHQLLIDPAFYSLAATLILAAIWMNGSFLSFVSTVKNTFIHKFGQWPG